MSSPHGVFRPSDLDMLARIVLTLEALLLFALVIGAGIGLLSVALIDHVLGGS
jgi:hypothetical protein